MTLPDAIRALLPLLSPELLATPTGRAVAHRAIDELLPLLAHHDLRGERSLALVHLHILEEITMPERHILEAMAAAWERELRRLEAEPTGPWLCVAGGVATAGGEVS